MCTNFAPLTQFWIADPVDYHGGACKTTFEHSNLRKSLLVVSSEELINKLQTLVEEKDKIIQELQNLVKAFQSERSATVSDSNVDSTNTPCSITTNSMTPTASTSTCTTTPRGT